MADKQKLYKKQILKHLYFSKSISCADLSFCINKSLVLTTRILNELIEEEKVFENGFAPSSGGRRAVMYSLRADVMHIVSVAMDQLTSRIIIVDMENRQVQPAMSFELKLKDNPQALPKLVEKIQQAIEKSGLPAEKIAGIGIGMPGFIDVGEGINYSFLDSDGVSITGYIGERTGLPVYIDNDSSLIALAELRFGAARKKRNAIVVNINWGIGIGMILNSELFRGHNGFAGEFSHIPLFTNNRLCSCGKHGCLETEASLLVVAEKAQKALQNGRLSILKPIVDNDYEKASNEIIQAAGKGDRLSIELLSEAGYHIGRGLAILIHILNPELIVLSGRGSMAGKIWQAPIQQALNEHCIPRLALNTLIEVSGLGHQAEQIGAAALVMENFDSDLNPAKRGHGKKISTTVL
ncbi:MAG: ROK family protein [Chitinophagaceae bacterium]|nr:MAG: ROK family protein [Chitinophagaceae bacterium]